MSGPPGKISRLKVWFARHKVLGPLLVILGGLAIVYLGAIVVVEIQTQVERHRFMQAKSLVGELAADLMEYNPRPATTRHIQSCHYTTHGDVFTFQTLSCESSIVINFQGLTETQAKGASSYLKRKAQEANLDIRNNESALEAYDLLDYTFSYYGLSCGFSTTYYDSSVVAPDRYSEALKKGNVLLMYISCSGQAKAEYFPVTKT